MTKSMWLRTIIGIVLSFTIALYVHMFLDSLSSEIEVVAAAQPIPEQTIITPEMIRIIKVNAEAYKTLTPKAARTIQEAVGSATVHRLETGSVIINDSSMLVRPHEQTAGSLRENDARMSLFIPPGMRAITVRADAEGALGFNLKKGDIVDVIFTSNSMETRGFYSKTIMQKIQVFDLTDVSDRNNANSNAVMQNITLLVTPLQAQQLTLAKRRGKIDLTLTPLTDEPETRLPTLPTYPQDFLP